MSQQVPFNNDGVPQGNVPQGNDMISAGVPTDASPGYAPQNVPAGSPDPYSGGGRWQPPQGPQTYARNKAPMIDPIESTKLTPQIMILLVLSGIKRHWKWSLPIGLIMGLLAAGVLYLVFPLQYESHVLLQIHSEQPTFIFAERAANKAAEFVNTQFAYMRSSPVIDSALENADVAKLHIVNKQKDKRDWLTNLIKTKSDGKSEVVAVSVSTDSEDASKIIVGAVVESYLTFIKNTALADNNKILLDIQGEKRRQLTVADNLQNNIRASAMAAARRGAAGDGIGLGQGESIIRDLAIARSQLVAKQAQRTAIAERAQKPAELPPEVLAQLNPAFRELNNEKELLIRRRELLAKSLSNPNDRMLQMIDRDINAIDDRIKKLYSGSEDGKQDAILRSLYINDLMTIWGLDQEIRGQDILVSELQKRYNEQLLNAAQRTDDTLRATFDQAQLARTNKVLDMIEDRILALTSESRAPDRVILLSPAINSRPNRIKQVATVGIGGMACLCAPLLLSVFIERMKPRLYHVSQVRRATPQVLIGEIMEPPVSWVHGASFRKRLARYRESVHDWCTHLLLSDPFRSCKTLSIASVAGDDGKTFLAVQIAVAMAQMKPGNVLLIDGDMRVGRLHLLFGNEETGIGLADVLAFRNGFGEAMVQNEREPNLHLLSAGQLDVTPYELLGDGRFRELLDMLEQNYSLILVVLPPVAHAAESLIMASSTDSTLLCVRQGETVLAAMEDVYRKLVNTGSSVDGIVVKDIPYYQMAGRDGGFADKLEQIRLSHLLQYAD